MIKIAHKTEAETLNHIPSEVAEKDDGGYILVVKNEDDINKLNDEIGIDVTTTIPEYVDLIK